MDDVEIRAAADLLNEAGEGDWVLSALTVEQLARLLGHVVAALAARAGVYPSELIDSLKIDEDWPEQLVKERR